MLKGKLKTVTELKSAAKKASEVWFATDLDREGEAIAWHVAQLLGVASRPPPRVVFNAITKNAIQRAFSNPHSIDMNKVDAQQARRILDRIVGYQVSPLLWKKVARGLSAGRVQSVAVRLVVEREREIRAFIPDENWRITGRFATDQNTASKLVDAWNEVHPQTDEKGNTPTIKAQNAWMTRRAASRPSSSRSAASPSTSPSPGDKDEEPKDLTDRVAEVAKLAGLTDVQTNTERTKTAKAPRSTSAPSRARPTRPSPTA